MKNVVLYMLFFCFFSCKKAEKRYMVVSKIKSAAKLVTTETLIDKVIFGSKERKFLGFVRLGEARYVATSHAIVKAGIDLEKITAKDIEINEKSIRINLPPIQVLSFSYPFETFVTDLAITDNSFFVKMGIQDFEYFYQQAELDIRRTLPYLGIQAATKQKTTLVMKGLLKNLGYEEIDLIFKEGKLIEEVPSEDSLHVE